MQRRSLQALFSVFVTFAAAFALAATGSAQITPRVLVVEFDNDVNPVTQAWVREQIERANEERYDAVLIELDTPGGLVDSMEEIVKAELASRVPVVVWVGPSGAEATSAGAFIAQAADVLAMAPATTIGSSTPIAGEGNLEGDARRKAINYLAAKHRGLARTHGRNPRWADAAVRQASNLPSDEALRRNVTDLLAPSIPSVLERIDGRRTQPKGIVMRTAGAQIERVELGRWKRVLDTLIDPNIIVLMMSIGLLGIVVELWHPGLIFPGTVGAISLIVGLYGLQVLPISWAGLLLMLLAAAFIAAEPFVVSHGALSVAGAVCFVLGALLLFEPAGPFYEVSIPLVLGIGGSIGVMTFLIVMKIVQVRRKPVEVGIHSVVGARGVVRRDGWVFVNGELWRARPDDGEALAVGREVEVAGVDDGLVLRVRAAREPERVS